MLRPYTPGQFQRSCTVHDGEFRHNLRAIEYEWMKVENFHLDHERLAGMLAAHKISAVGSTPELLQRVVDMHVAECLACSDPNSPVGFRNRGACARCTRLSLGVVVATTGGDDDSASVHTRVPAADGSDTRIVTWDQSRFRHVWKSAAGDAAADSDAPPVERASGGELSVRARIVAAGRLRGAAVVELPAGEHPLGGGEIDVDGALTLRGSGAGATVLTGPTASLSVGLGGHLVVTGVTFSGVRLTTATDGARADWRAEVQEQLAGEEAWAGARVTLTDCCFQNCQTDGDDGGAVAAAGAGTSIWAGSSCKNASNPSRCTILNCRGYVSAKRA